MPDSQENTKELKDKAVRGVFWSLLEQAGGQATQFITFLLLARLLAPESFGLISLANIFIHFVQALIGSGFSDAIIQRKNLEKGHLDTAFWSSLGIGCFLTGIGVATSGLIAQFFRQPELQPIVMVLSFNVLINSFAGTQSAILTRELNFRGLTLRRVISMLAGSAVGIALAVLNFGVWSLVAQTLVTSLVGCLLLWSISTWRPGFQVAHKYFKDLFSFGINVVGIGLLVFFSRRIDDFLIGYFLGTTALGYYTVAYKIFVSLIQIIQQATQKVSFTAFSKLQDQPRALKKALYNSTGVISLFGIPVFIGMALVAPEFVQIFFGEQWLPSIPVMQILAFNGVLVAAMSFTGPFINALGKPLWNLGLLLLSTVTRTVAFMLFIQKGIILIAFVLVISNYILLPTNIWVLCHLSKISWLKFLKQVFPSILAASIMSVSVLLFKRLCAPLFATQPIFVLSILIGALVYTLAVWLLLPDMFHKMLNLARSALPSKL